MDVVLDSRNWSILHALTLPVAEPLPYWQSPPGPEASRWRGAECAARLLKTVRGGQFFSKDRECSPLVADETSPPDWSTDRSTTRLTFRMSTAARHLVSESFDFLSPERPRRPDAFVLQFGAWDSVIATRPEAAASDLMAAFSTMRHVLSTRPLRPNSNATSALGNATADAPVAVPYSVSHSRIITSEDEWRRRPRLDRMPPELPPMSPSPLTSPRLVLASLPKPWSGAFDECDTGEYAA